MKNISMFPALILWVSLSALAAKAPAASHPIVGKWKWTRDTNKCTETYDYRSDGTLFVTSGAEESDSTYTISEKPDANGFFELKGRPVRSNGAKDCSESAPKGDTGPFTLYIIFHKTEPLHLVCQTPALDHCYGPLRRVEP